MWIKMVGIKSEEFNETYVLGYHIYDNVWKTVIGKELRWCQRKEDSPRDPYAVAVTKSHTGVVGMEIVGHVLHYLSTLYLLFIRQSGAVYWCIATGMHRYSKNLSQGGMEIPCKYNFIGNCKGMKKIQSYISSHSVKG